MAERVCEFAMHLSRGHVGVTSARSRAVGYHLTRLPPTSKLLNGHCVLPLHPPLSEDEELKSHSDVTPQGVLPDRPVPCLFLHFVTFTQNSLFFELSTSFVPLSPGTSAAREQALHLSWSQLFPQSLHVTVPNR